MDDIERAAQRRYEAQRRRRDLVCVHAIALLRRLVAMGVEGELDYDALGMAYCLFCLVEPDGEHEPECLFRQARELLREVDRDGE